MIMLPYMPMICLVAILGAMLQVHGRFGPAAAVPIVLNICLIGASVGLAPQFGADDRWSHVTVVAASVIVAGLVQLLWMGLVLRGTGRFALDVKPAWGSMRAVLRQAGPMILGLGVLQLNVFFDGVIASYPTTIGPTIFGVDYPLGQGALAVVSFAQRLYQFPLGVFGIAVATAIFPALARLADDKQAFADILRRGLRLVLFIGLPASAGLALVGPLLVGVILEGGQFGADDADRVVFVLYGYSAAVWAYSIIHVFTRAFYAMGDAKTPVKVAVVMVAVNLVLNCTLIWTGLREAGLAWSTALCAVVQSIVLLALMRRRVPDLLGSAVAASVARTAALTVAMTVAVAGALAVMPDAVTWSQSLVTLLVAVGIGLLVVAGGARLLRMPELRWALGRS
jgi:putative peptidoglycan lipid II flippase